ncbi:MAG: PspA/IM30 family protein [Alphaproteobacteria bacterium]|nr:hypothetical protein [Candidatus Jidaibacter sp.]
MLLACFNSIWIDGVVMIGLLSVIQESYNDPKIWLLSLSCTALLIPSVYAEFNSLYMKQYPSVMTNISMTSILESERVKHHKDQIGIAEKALAQSNGEVCTLKQAIQELQKKISDQKTKQHDTDKPIQNLDF